MLRAACEDARIRALVAAGAPVAKYDFSRLVHCDRPKLFVQGALDEFGPPAELTRFVDLLDGPKQLTIIAGADHFFDGHLDEMGEAVAQFIAQHSNEQTAAQQPTHTDR